MSVVSLCGENVHGVLARDLGAGPVVLTAWVFCVGSVEPHEALLVVFGGAEAHALVTHDEGVAEVPGPWSCSSGRWRFDVGDVLVGRGQEHGPGSRREAAGTFGVLLVVVIGYFLSCRQRALRTLTFVGVSGALLLLEGEGQLGSILERESLGGCRFRFVRGNVESCARWTGAVASATDAHPRAPQAADARLPAGQDREGRGNGHQAGGATRCRLGVVAGARKHCGSSLQTLTRTRRVSTRTRRVSTVSRCACNVARGSRVVTGSAHTFTRCACKVTVQARPVTWRLVKPTVQAEAVHV